MNDDTALFKSLPAKRTFEGIVDQIRDLIYSRKLNPGDKLPPERELAEKFRAGRTAVREALRVLEQSGLIVVKQGSEGGSFVKDVDTTVVSESITDVIRRTHVEISHLTEVRIGVEKLVIGVAIARIGKDELHLLEEHVNRAQAIMEELERDSNLEAFESWAQTNFQFHLVLARATRNPLFVMILESLMNVVHTFLGNLTLVPKFLHEHVNDHRRIFEAVRNRDLRLAERLLEQHSLEQEKTLSYRRETADKDKGRNKSDWQERVH
jgi:GntR family transcriptional repressor for pyruvate dehydrogenase complex